MVKHHGIRVTAPYYAASSDGTMLHRYLDDQFIDRFQREASTGKLAGRSAQRWLTDDRFGKDRVVLRLPIHRTFYVVSCEVSCDRQGQPALDPARIVSAGLVVRKGTPHNYQTWQVRDGVAIGWRPANAIDHEQEPDHYRRLVKRGFIKSKPRTPPYSGEQTHPLHTQLVNTQTEQHSRNHTLLFGYLPLSGSVEASLASEVEDNTTSAAAATQVSATGQLAEHEWPFGSWDGENDRPACDCTGQLSEVVDEIAQHFQWQEQTGLQVDSGVPTRAFAGLLRTLMQRYQVFDASIEDNEALRYLLSQIYFYDGILVNVGVAGDASTLGRPVVETLLHYLQTHRDDLFEWLAELDRQDNLRLKAGQAPLVNLPVLPGTTKDLYVRENQAANLREQLVLRAEQAEQLIEKSLPLPRYTQGKEDYYFVVPFVRYRNDCGDEAIAWGSPSQTFRVASPLDAEAARPVVIQLPEFQDLKRGFAKGVTFLTPRSMAEALNSVVPDMEFKKQNKKNRLDACLGFSISFSIPIITICAMILLMIILNLLNLIFFWLPWAFLQLPRLCRK